MHTNTWTTGETARGLYNTGLSPICFTAGVKEGGISAQLDILLCVTRAYAHCYIAQCCSGSQCPNSNNYNGFQFGFWRFCMHLCGFLLLFVQSCIIVFTGNSIMLKGVFVHVSAL